MGFSSKLILYTFTYAVVDNRKYSNAVQDDLWAALTAQATIDNVPLPVDVRTIMNTWTLKMVTPLHEFKKL